MENTVEKVAEATQKAKATAWTPELVRKVIADYDGGKGLTIEAIAEKHGLGKRSVLGKLVYEKEYVKPEKVLPTYVDTGPSKKDWLKKLEGFGLSEDAIKGLTNATKPALAEVAERLAKTA